MVEHWSARELLDRCRESGDEAAWRELVRRFERRLRCGIGRGFRRAGLRPRRELIDDLLQDVYCRLLEQDCRALRGCRGEGRRSIGAYLSRIAERVALDSLRAGATAKRGGSRIDSLQELVENGGEEVLAIGPLAERRLLTAELRQRFLAACRKAAGRGGRATLEVLKLALLDGLTSREISERLGNRLSPNGIDSLLYRARRRLAEQGMSVPRRRSVGAGAPAPG